MNGNDYQTLALSTAKPYWKNQDILVTLRLANGILALCGEAGELANKMKKYVENIQIPDYRVLEDELGDVLWYVALVAWLLDVDLEDVMGHNIAKLRERYKDILPQQEFKY